MTVLSHPPAELTTGRLKRLGEGIGKVVYASERWVVKRERSPAEIVALILLWKFLRRVEHLLPGSLGQKLLSQPTRRIRFLRVLVQGVVLVVPRSLWYSSHIGEIWRLYTTRDEHGQDLADEHLTGTDLVPERVEFPPTRVKVGGWPGWLTVSEATERVEATLHQRLADLAGTGDFDGVEMWLNRLLDVRQQGWQRGLFSVDAHLKNFGVTGERVVLLDAGGLTRDFGEVEKRLSRDNGDRPHVQLGLGSMLAGRPDIAERFDKAWRATVNLETVRRLWPGG